MNNAFIYILKLFILLTLISCISKKKLFKNDQYQILNLEVNSLTDDKNDTIFIQRETSKSYIKELIKNKELIWRTKSEELKELFNDNKEINFLVNQLKNDFRINLSKINSKLVKEYIDPLKRLDKSGNIIRDYYYIKIHGSRKYTFSKPIFTTDRKFGMFIKVRHDNSIGIRIYKKNNGKWEFFKNIGIAVI